MVLTSPKPFAAGSAADGDTTTVYSQQSSAQSSCDFGISDDNNSQLTPAAKTCKNENAPVSITLADCSDKASNDKNVLPCDDVTQSNGLISHNPRHNMSQENNYSSCNTSTSGAGDESRELNENSLLRDFHSNVISWISNDSSCYVEDADGLDTKGITDTSTTESVTDRATEGVMNTVKTEVMNTTETEVLMANAETEEIMANAETDEIMNNTATEEIMANAETEEIMANAETEEIMANAETEEIMNNTATEEIMANAETEEIMNNTATEEIMANAETEEIMANAETEEIMANAETEEIMNNTATEEIMNNTATEEIINNTATEETVNIQIEGENNTVVSDCALDTSFNESVTNTTTTMTECVQDTTTTMTECVQDTTTTMTECVQDTTTTMTECVQDTTTTMTECVQDTTTTMTECVQDTTTTMTECVQDTTTTMTECVQDTTTTMTECVQDTTTTMTEAITDTIKTECFIDTVTTADIDTTTECITDTAIASGIADTVMTKETTGSLGVTDTVMAEVVTNTTETEDDMNKTKTEVDMNTTTTEVDMNTITTEVDMNTTTEVDMNTTTEVDMNTITTEVDMNTTKCEGTPEAIGIIESEVVMDTMIAGVTDVTTVEGLTDTTTDVVTDTITDDVTDTSTDVVTDTTTDVVTDTTTDVVTDTTTDVVTDTATDVVTDTATDVITDTTTDDVMNSTATEDVRNTTTGISDISAKAVVNNCVVGCESYKYKEEATPELVLSDTVKESEDELIGSVKVEVMSPNEHEMDQREALISEHDEMEPKMKEFDAAKEDIADDDAIKMEEESVPTQDFSHSGEDTSNEKEDGLHKKDAHVQSLETIRDGGELEEGGDVSCRDECEKEEDSTPDVLVNAGDEAVDTKCDGNVEECENVEAVFNYPCVIHGKAEDETEDSKENGGLSSEEILCTDENEENMNEVQGRMEDECLTTTPSCSLGSVVAQYDDGSEMLTDKTEEADGNEEDDGSGEEEDSILRLDTHETSGVNLADELAAVMGSNAVADYDLSPGDNDIAVTHESSGVNLADELTAVMGSDSAPDYQLSPVDDDDIAAIHESSGVNLADELADAIVSDTAADYQLSARDQLADAMGTDAVTDYGLFARDQLAHALRSDAVVDYELSARDQLADALGTDAATDYELSARDQLADVIVSDAAADYQLSTGDDDVIVAADVSSTDVDCEAPGPKKRRLQQNASSNDDNDDDDEPSQVVALQAMVAELQQINRDANDRVKSYECRLSDATVALTVRVEALRDAQTRIQYLEQEQVAKDEALHDAARKIHDLQGEIEAPSLTDAQCTDLNIELMESADKLGAAEESMQMLKEALNVQMEANKSLQAAMVSNDEEVDVKINMLESQLLDYRRSSDELVAGLRRELQCKTECTEAQAKEMSDAEDVMRNLRSELDRAVERNEALKIQMNDDECKAVEQLLVTAERLGNAEEVNASLMEEASRRADLLSDAEARVIALQEELTANDDIVDGNTGLKTTQEMTYADAARFQADANDIDTVADSGFNIDATADTSLMTDMTSESILKARSNTDSSTELEEQSILDDLESCEVQYITQQHRSRFDASAAGEARPDLRIQISTLQTHLARLGNAVTQKDAEKSALQDKIAGLRQQATDTQEAHDSEVFTLLESYVDLEGRRNEKAPQLVNTVGGGASVKKKKRASAYYHPEQDVEDTSGWDRDNEVTMLKAEVNKRDDVIQAVRSRAEAELQQLQVTVDRLETKVRGQGEEHNAWTVEMEAMQAFAAEMLANEREAHRVESEQLLVDAEAERLGHYEISQQLGVLNQELSALIASKGSLEERLKTMEGEREEMMLSHLGEGQSQMCASDVELERETYRAELERLQMCSQDQERELVQQLAQMQEKLISVTALGESLEQDCQRVTMHAEQLEVVNAEMEVRSECVSNELRATVAESAVLKVNCDALTLEVEDLRGDVDALNQQSEELRGEKTALTAEKESLGAQLELSKELSENLQLDKTTLVSEKGNLREQVIELQELVDGLRVEQETMAARMDDHERQLAELKQLSEDLQEEKETMSEVNLKLLDDTEMMEEQNEQLTQRVELLSRELEQLKSAAQSIHTEPALELNCPQDRSREHLQNSASKASTGVKRKLDTTGFDDDHCESASAPVEACTNCEARSAEVFNLMGELQKVLDEKNKLQTVLDTSLDTTTMSSQTEVYDADTPKLQLTTSSQTDVYISDTGMPKEQLTTSSQTEFNTSDADTPNLQLTTSSQTEVYTSDTDMLKGQLTGVQSELATLHERLHEKDMSCSEYQQRLAALDEDRERHVSLCSELQGSLVLAEEELCKQLQEKDAYVIESDRKIADLEKEVGLRTSLCGDVREQMAKAQEDLCVKELMYIESESSCTELSNKVKTLESNLAVESQTMEELRVRASTLQSEKVSIETESEAMQLVLADTTDTVVDLQESLKVLQTENDCADEKAAELHERLASLEQRETEQEAKLTTSRESIGELEVQAGVLTSKLEDAEEQNRRLECRLNTAVVNCEEAKLHRCSVEEELGVSSTRLAEANALRSQMEEQCESFRLQLEVAVCEKDEAVERLKTTVESLESATSSREESTETLSTMRAILDEKTKHVGELEAKLSHVTGCLEEECNEMVEQDVALESCASLLREAEARAESLQGKLAEATDAAKRQAVEIEAELDTVLGNQQQSNERMLQMESQLKGVTAKQEKAEADLTSVRGEKSALEKELRATAEELEAKRISLAELRDEGSGMQEQLESLQRRLDEATTDGAASEETIKTLRNESDQRQCSLDSLKEENWRLQETGEETAERLKVAEDECTAKTEEIDRLRSELEEVSSGKVAQHDARVNDLCEERDDLSCKVTLLTTNARRMDRDVKRLQADYDKLCDDKRQGGDQQVEITTLKKELESLNERLKTEVDELNASVSKQTKLAACHLDRYRSLMKRYGMLEEENDKLKDELEGPVVTPPRKSRRLKQVPTVKAGTKRSATGRAAGVMPKKMLRSQDQELYVTMTTSKEEVKEDVKVLKVTDECIVPNDAIVKPVEPTTKSHDDATKPSEQFVTTRLRSRAPSGGGGVKQKTMDESSQPEMELRALATISNSPRKKAPVSAVTDKKPVVTQQQLVRKSSRRRSRDPVAKTLEGENCKVQ